jgi:hypothetical protein
MASQFQTSNISNLAASTAISLTKPTGTIDGDLLITVICSAGTAAPSGVPSGWTLIRSNDSGGSGTQASMHSYYKVASSEGASYSWTASGGPSGGMVLRITGQDSTHIDVSTGTGAQTSGGVGNDMSSGSTISAARVNELIIMAAVVYDTDVGTPSLSDWKIATNNPTWTELYDNSLNAGSGNNWVMGLAYALRTDSGATGAPSFDWTGGSGWERYAAQTILVSNLNAQTFTETVTCTDTHVNNVGFNLTVADSVTPTDTVTSEKQKTWATQNKSSTTWTNIDKS